MNSCFSYPALGPEQGEPDADFTALGKKLRRFNSNAIKEVHCSYCAHHHRPPSEAINLVSAMTSARLSPAASLLRNSKLFSLPPTLTPPLQEASSRLISRSDTATTPYPIRAAIETPQLSLNRGDWGLKRALPLKTTTKTGTPVIRVQRGLDTPEHTVDFESAADHVLTLQKWQHLHMPVQYPSGVNTGYDDKRKYGVFNPSEDNTTNISNKSWTGVWPSIAPEDRALHVPKGPKETATTYMSTKTEEAELTGAPLPVTYERRVPEQKAVKRWRYKGPWLAGMSAMEFDEFLKREVRTQTWNFRDRVERQWLADRVAAKKAKALEEGRMEEVEPTTPLENFTIRLADTPSLKDVETGKAPSDARLAARQRRNLRVGNLPAGINEDHMKDMFSEYNLESFTFSSVLRPDGSSQRKAFVVVKSAEDAQRAISAWSDHAVGMSDEVYSNYIRTLRKRPQVFGPIVAEFLDLPDGPKPPTASLASRQELWEYGRDTAAAASYRNTGPPRTHPSAGLSYSGSRNWAANDARYGPQKDPTPVVGRILKVIRSGSNTSATVGVAGFVTPRMDRTVSRGNTDLSGFTPRPGGQKLLVVPSAAMVNVEGLLDLHVQPAPDTHVLENDEAVRQEARKLPETSSYGSAVPQLDTNYKKADPLPEGFSRTRK